MASVGTVATAWRHDRNHPVGPGDFVTTIGFVSPDYLMVNLAYAYGGSVSVPLQHTASAAQLRPIIAEVGLRFLAAGAEYLDVAFKCVTASSTCAGSSRIPVPGASLQIACAAPSPSLAQDVPVTARLRLVSACPLGCGACRVAGSAPGGVMV